MASKVISIEMGFSITKVCEIDYLTENPKVYSSFVLETPQGVLAEDGTVNSTEAFAEQFHAMLVQKGMRTKQAVFSISSSKIASREVLIPFVKENRISLLIQANAAEYFPIDLAAYELAYSILGTQGDEDKKQYRLMVLAAPKELLESYKKLANALGLEILSMDYASNSVYNAVQRECIEGTQMVIKVDERATLIMVLEGGGIVLSRNVPYGIDQAIYSIMSNSVFGEKLSYKDALELARRKTCISPSAEEQDTSETEFTGFSQELITQARKEVTNALTSLIGGVARVLDYYNSRNSATPVRKIKLTGLGGDFSGLSKLLTNEIGTRVKVLTKIEGIALDKGLKDVSFGEYVTCIGASMHPVGFNGISEDEKKTIGKVNTNKVGVIVLIVGVSIGIILASFSIFAYLAEKNLKNKLESEINTLQPAYDTYSLYVQAKNDYGKMSSLNALTFTRIDDLVAFLDEMENTMPSSLRVSTFLVNTEGVSMEVTVDSMEAVAKTIAQFKLFESLDFADTQAVTRAGNELGENGYSFSVTLLFKPLADASLDGTETTE